ncbi:nuclear transport factor 2 family protein [Pseudomonas aeruginosa]|uniref:nuclear transport factor 2 family protein n=1 Tax=Pseudomonas aeruginosa TaxID=287 RepID=UPI00071BC1C9|nr:nuclear transport factor 2 family protein [Pseudomonas aeruginosa]KSQ25004.1 hypothetical protein APB28_00565 [Pseudomonas aeruginosa]MCO1687936.1 nuclear transport factor 2 family protein [Pseudomonas aeruginosa]MCO1778562.1 nuclear transport factor 2 family protein [Pseudomonas aeruginosa]MCO1790129.1 nuclear transport factor 2 family protein [Pseudomonas aeruginosa]MCO1799231.1 nuclear transport factor 2 family protein [Pseudomonas aeruginosa]
MTANTQRLIDESNIQKLTAAYSHAIMRLDATAAAATYAEHGVLSAFYAPEIIGRQAIAETLATTLAPIQFICQTASSGVIDVEGDRARASWTITELLRFRDKEELACCFGLYEDVLQRCPGGWHFVSRRFVPFYRGSIPSTGKLYREPSFQHDYAPWPLLINTD